MLSLTVYADHYQFYLQDCDSDPDTSQLWDGKALERHVGVLPGLIGVGTSSYDDVALQIEVRDAAPNGDLEPWEHVAEAGVEVASCRLFVVECMEVATPETPHVDVPPDTYRVRIHWAGLESGDENTTDERYLIQLWPDAMAGTTVLKWWSEWDPGRLQPWETEAHGQLLFGAQARIGSNWRMVGSGSSEGKFLFQDESGTYWEHGYVDSWAPYLEELTPEIAARRFDLQQD